MPIKVNCPSCDKLYTLADAMAGKRVRCKECTETIVVPNADTEAAPALAEGSRRQGLQSSPTRATEKPSRAEEANDDTDRPSRRPPKAKASAADGAKSALFILLAIGAVVLLVCGGAIGGLIYLVMGVNKSINNTIAAETKAADKPSTEADKAKNEQEKSKKDGGPKPEPVKADPGEPKDISFALGWLREPNPLKRKRAAEWLTRQAPDPKRRNEVYKALQVAVNDPDVGVSEAAHAAEVAWSPPVEDGVVPVEGNALRDVNDALFWMRDIDPVKRRKAVEWLVTAPPDPARKNEVVAALETLQKTNPTPTVKRAIQSALTRWRADAPPPPVVAPQVEAAPDMPRDVNDAVVWLADMDGGKAKKAAAWLEKQNPDAAHRAAVTAALDQAVTKNTDVFARDTYLNALAVWADVSTVPLLVKSLDNGINDRVAAVLVELKDPRGAAGLAKRMDGLDFFKAKDALRKMGPAAEDAVVDALFNAQNPTARHEALRILEVIGTKKSVPRVQQAMRQDNSFQYQGDRTIQAIRNR